MNNSTRSMGVCKQSTHSESTSLVCSLRANHSGEYAMGSCPLPSAAAPLVCTGASGAEVRHTVRALVGALEILRRIGVKTMELGR